MRIHRICIDIHQCIHATQRIDKRQCITGVDGGSVARSAGITIWSRPFSSVCPVPSSTGTGVAAGIHQQLQQIHGLSRSLNV